VEAGELADELKSRLRTGEEHAPLVASLQPIYNGTLLRQRELERARAQARRAVDDYQRTRDDDLKLSDLQSLHGCTLAETAEHLDRTVASVIGLLRRGLKRLRELLQEPTTGYR
jgi:DNA-directed RNA polymerase specialized sigma24 family protein